ncbi:MAG: YgiT-type zinc finger protein [Calditrichales bacterium]|nr:YgiT-type zinc finger protein [Calditrichales bacterium]
MNCLYCNGKLIRTKEVFHVDRHGIHLTIDEIDVYKCDTCGEIMIDTKEVSLIQETLVNLENALNKKVA